jgi:primosomal protein N' (replication factor Y)
MKDRDQQIANIVPTKKMPRDLMQIFSYEIPAELEKQIKVGSLVTIPFRRSTIQGIVFSLSPMQKTEFQLKPITNILDSRCFSEKNLEFAKFIADYYYCPISWVIDAMVPEIPKKAARKKIELHKLPEIEKLEKDRKEKILNEIRDNKKIVLLHNFNSKRLDLYRSIAKTQKSKSQTLILMPEYFDIYSSAQFFIDNFGEEKVAIINSEITKNQYYQEWQKIRSGEAKIIIGTRQAVLMPFQNLVTIIVDEEHNPSHKQWEPNPRYHGRDMAIKLSEIFDARIILSSPTLSLETFQKTKESFKLVSAIEQKNAKPEVLDMEVERKNGNYSLLSEKLQESLLQNIYEKKQAVVFIPRLGNYTAFQCKGCGYIATCETCDNTLIGHKDQLYCSKCKKQYKLLTSCPKCQGQNITSFGCGSARILEEIDKLFEGKNIKVTELNSKTLEDISNQQKIYKDFSNGKIDILVGTQMILKNWNMKNLALIGIVFPETIFSQNSFRSKEKIWQTLFRFYNLPQDKEVIIQTYKPESPFFEEMKNSIFQDFLNKELEDRKVSISKIKYPPFDKIIKLIYKNADPVSCEKEARWQYDVLRKEISIQKMQDFLEIISPFPAQNYREHGKYRWHIILRHKKNLNPKDRDQILFRVKKDWIIDIDPDEIL